MLAAAASTVPAPKVNTYGLSRDDLITLLRASPETVDGWLSGARRRPPYFDLAVRAAHAGLHPISAALVKNYWRELGVEKARVNFWMNSGQTPVQARMAVAWLIHSGITGRR